MKCFICGEIINKQNGRHIYSCAKKNELCLEKKEIKFRYYSYNCKFVISKEFLEDLYLNKRYSLPDFKNEFQWSYRQTQFLLGYFDIKQRKIKEACNEKSRHEKYEKTCEKKYGLKNASQADEVKEKKRQTFLKNYGVDNIWKSKEYYVWLHEHMLDKYGSKSVPNINNNADPFGLKNESQNHKIKRIKKAKEGFLRWWNQLSGEEKDKINKKKSIASKFWWDQLTDEEKNYRVNKLIKSSRSSGVSSLETKIKDVLSDLKISYTHQFFIGRKSYDFRLASTRVLIEVQGDFWHGNPKLYKADDTLNFGGGNLYKASDLWDVDYKKKELAIGKGYKLIYIWEDDMKRLKYDELVYFVLNTISSVMEVGDCNENS